MNRRSFIRSVAGLAAAAMIRGLPAPLCPAPPAVETDTGLCSFADFVAEQKRLFPDRWSGRALLDENATQRYNFAEFFKPFTPRPQAT